LLAGAVDQTVAVEKFGVTDPLPRFRIGIGADGVNRDLWASGQPPWSWHVLELTGWFDACFEPRFAHPRDIERAVLAGGLTDGDEVAIQNVCTVIAELTDEPRLFCETAQPLGMDQSGP
jgi:hypothetical protein